MRWLRTLSGTHSYHAGEPVGLPRRTAVDSGATPMTNEPKKQPPDRFSILGCSITDLYL